MNPNSSIRTAAPRLPGNARRLCAVVLVVAGCARGSATPLKLPPGMVVGPENIAVVKRQRISLGPPITGTLTPEEQATIRAEVGGAVLQTDAEQGQRVDKGATLLRIDDAALRQQVTAAQSSVTTAEATVALDQREVDRNKVLLDSGAIAPRDLEQLQNTLSAGRAQLANAQAQLATAQKELDKTVVLAPFTGVVSARQVSAGDVVSVGSALYTVVNPATMQLEASVPAEALSAVQLGTPVDFAVTGYTDRTFTGRITRINPIADASTREVRLIVSLPNPGGSLVGGLFADGRVSADTHLGAVVPTDAVNQQGIRPTVVRLHNGRVEPVPVTLGVRDPSGETVEITSGVAVGDTVLLGGARGIAPNTPVMVGASGEIKGQ
ncbi:MAG TPA: efflux RND transporter periplasmic adaptor subunit [Gemmatimonadaceae bacterium]|nr:efflux RND transporter periplasmic adaptor subunit [Gemmatimonadaceae bacterium]